ncbi:hypothetical protein RHMOL_Rhmol08G0021900 [Rhododendron molle]|uniref:Uncharacterized protein n=1 Tax=Rhododendron molle TaxID=49168 RepID=A0ACC0MIT8_RHOML|nr:hypothetical protein RHMOL_Rhmol08G0021900 [Rhododendron molle]
MALCNSKSPTHFQIQHSRPILFLNFLRLITIFFLILLFPFANSISFNFPSFNPDDQYIQYEGNATAANGKMQVTTNLEDASPHSSVGRASYSPPIHLWDNETKNLADFITHFSFIIYAINDTIAGDGLTFFLSPTNATQIPVNSSGAYLGLFDDSTALDYDTNNQAVAVEFDTFPNHWDPSLNHVGIDVHSIRSATQCVWETGLANNEIANAWVIYNSSTTTLSVYLTYDENPVFQGNYMILSYVVDLRNVLPEWVNVGFSAATGSGAEIHNIVSWNFNSTLEDGVVGSHKMNLRLVFGLAVIVGTLSCGVGLFWFMKRKNINSRGNNDTGVDASTDDDDIEKGKGPRRFRFSELSHATNNFFEGGKLGEGGFGGVYKGVLNDGLKEIAVKRISKGSKQGKKEFKSEVKIISRLRHRNLVQLVGWCHEQEEFLLIYEFMPNGSLDTHLFGGKSKLTWTVRYKIALGLAFALLYLHEEWEQCVIHRDIKSSNIMLDSNYNARLGDFGLARLVDHELGLETTVLAGTMGYLAPECVITGNASKESYVYSFGVVALEIACGRKPILELNRDLGRHERLSEWVWSLYGKGQLLEAVDKDLTMEYDEHQLERLMSTRFPVTKVEFALNNASIPRDIGHGFHRFDIDINMVRARIPNFLVSIKLSGHNLIVGRIEGGGALKKTKESVGGIDRDCSVEGRKEEGESITGSTEVNCFYDERELSVEVCQDCFRVP